MPMSSGDRFPTTRFTVLLRSGSKDSSVRRDAFEEIISAYWKPVYKYIRLKWRVTREEAEDLVQAFFALAFEKGYFARYEQDKARFRTFILRCLKGFLSKENRNARRLKRGGDAIHLSLDFETAEGEILERNLAVDYDADEVFYQEWVKHILGLAADDLRRKYDLAGKSAQWEIFRRYDLEADDSDRPKYDELARQFDLPVTQVTNYLAAARRDFRGLVLARVRAATNSEKEFVAESERLFKAVIR